MTTNKLSQTALSSPDVASLAGSVASEDRLDSDLEADLQHVGLMENIQAIEIENFSVTSSDILSGPSGNSECRARVSTSDTGAGPATFFRKALLSGVSSQLKNASTKVDVGTPSCLSFRRYLIIGTTKGVIFGFNLQQVLRFCLGSIDSSNGGAEPTISPGQGSVSVLSQTMDGTRLLSGYQSGRLAVWRLTPPPETCSPQHESHMVRGKLSVGAEDSEATGAASAPSGLQQPERASTDLASSPIGSKSAASRVLQRTLSGAKLRLVGRPSSDAAIGQLLYVIDDAHGAGQAIAFASFTTLSSIAVSVDTGGSVFALNFKRGLTGSRKDSICFFSGSRGEICALDALGSTALLSNTGSDESASTGVDRNQESVQRSVKSSLGSYALVAMASFTKLIVAQLRPRLQIAYWQPLTGPVACLPLVTWQWGYRTSHGSSAGSGEHALLAFGRGSTFRLLQVTKATSATGFDSTKAEEVKTSLHFETLHTFDLQYELMCLNWISSSQVAALDATEKLHLLDSLTGEDAETVDLSSIQLCHTSYLFQSPADGGSVSEALAYAGQRACSQSVATHGSQMLILGRTGVHLVALRTWTDIVRSLLSHGMLDAALIYCQRALESTLSQHADSEFSRLTFDDNCKQVPAIPNPNLSVVRLRSEILTMLREHLTPVLCNTDSGNNRDDKQNDSINETGCIDSEHIAVTQQPLNPLTVSRVVRVACLVENCEFFVADLYENLRRDPQTRSWLFVAIYESVFCRLTQFGQLCSDKLDAPIAPGEGCTALAYSLPPNLVMDWIRWCLTPEYDVDRANWTGTVGELGGSGCGRLWAEQAILCLPPHCLDLNEAVRLCWRYHLFKAYLHLYTDVLLDFETPFRELFNQLNQPGEPKRCSVTDDSDTSGTKMADLVPYSQTLLLLLRNALAGESYSQQSLPNPMDVDVPTHLFNLLLNEALPEKTVGHHRQPQFQPKYPRLWLLLSHTATDFLNLLTLSIGSDRFFSSTSGDLGISHRNHLYHKLLACALEELSSVAIDYNLDTTCTSSKNGPATHLPHSHQFAIPVFGFLAQQLLSVTDVPVQLNPAKMFQLFEQICLHLEKYPSGSLRAFETCVVDLIETEQFAQLDACLKVAARAKLFYLSEHIYRKLGRRVEAFEAQLHHLAAISCHNHRVRVEPGHVKQTVDSELEQLAIMVFAFIEQAFSYTCVHVAHVCGLSPEEIERTRSLVLSNVELLATWDGERILRLLYNMFRLNLPELLAKIAPDFHKFSDATASEPPVDNVACVLILRAYYRARQLQLDLGSAQGETSGTWSAQRHKTSIRLNMAPNETDWGQFLTQSHPEVADYYVRVLARCPSDAEQLLRFLETNSDYRADCVLTFLTPTDHPRECAYLYEKCGQFEKAACIYEQMFVTRWHALLNLVSIDCDQPRAVERCVDKRTEARAEAKNAADLWFSFTQRRCALLPGDGTAESCEPIWFHVIDVLLREERATESQALESDINDLFHSLLSYLPRSISLTAIVSYILQSATSQTTSRFSPQTSNLLIRLVATCHLEVEQMALNCELAKRELTQKQSELLARLRQGISVASKGTDCDLCHASLRSSRYVDLKRIRETNNSINVAKCKPFVVVFRCEHIFHAHCLRLAGAVETDVDGATTRFGFRRQWICPLCNPCPILSGLTKSIDTGSVQAQSGCALVDKENSKVEEEEDYLSWYDPIRLDACQHSNNPFV